MRTFCHTLGGTGIEFVSAVAYLSLASRVLCFRSSMRLSRLFFFFLLLNLNFICCCTFLSFLLSYDYGLSFTRVMNLGACVNYGYHLSGLLFPSLQSSFLWIAVIVVELLNYRMLRESSNCSKVWARRAGGSAFVGGAILSGAGAPAPPATTACLRLPRTLPLLLLAAASHPHTIHHAPPIKTYFTILL